MEEQEEAPAEAQAEAQEEEEAQEAAEGAVWVEKGLDLPESACVLSVGQERRMNGEYPVMSRNAQSAIYR